MMVTGLNACAASSMAEVRALTGQLTSHHRRGPQAALDETGVLREDRHPNVRRLPGHVLEPAHVNHPAGEGGPVAAEVAGRLRRVTERLDERERVVEGVDVRRPRL